MMTVPEVAKRVGKTPAAIYFAIREGWLNAQQKYGIWLISSEDLKNYNPRKRGRPEVAHRLPTDISQSALARKLGVSRQRVNQMLRKEAHNARVTVANAIKNGAMVKPDACERCSSNSRKLQAHHPDYARKLDVQWLCSPCHSLVHPHHPNVHGNFPATPKTPKPTLDADTTGLLNTEVRQFLSENGRKGGRPRHSTRQYCGQCQASVTSTDVEAGYCTNCKVKL